MFASLRSESCTLRELLAELGGIPFARDVDLQVAVLEPKIDMIRFNDGIELLPDLRWS